MALEKKIMTRIINKNASLAEWEGSSLILKKGEIALAYVETYDPLTSAKVPTYLMKVGDGEKTFSQLKFLAAPASDVYEWAKSAKVTDVTEISAVIAESAQNKLDIAANLASISALQKAFADAGLGGEQNVSALIAAAIEALDGSTTGEGTIVKAVSQTDGKISVTMGTLSAEEIPELGIAKITGLGDRLSAIEKSVSDEAAARGTAIEGIDTAYKAADTALGGRIDGVVGRVEALEARPFDTYATKTEVGAVQTDLDTAEEKIGTLEQKVADLEAATTLADAKGYTDQKIAAEVERADGAYDAKGAAATAETNAKNYVDQVKATILGENDKLVATYDTLSEIGQWIENTGSDVTDLAQTIADMDTAYKAADATLTTGVTEAKAAAKAADDKAVAAQSALDTFKQGHSYTDEQVDAKVADAKAAGTGAKTYAEGVAQDLADAQSALQAELEKKLAIETYNNDKAGFATKTELTEGLGSKVDTSAYNSKVTELEGAIGARVTQEAYNAKVQSIETSINGIDGRVNTLEGKKFVEYTTVEVAGGDETVYVLDCGGIN